MLGRRKEGEGDGPLGRKAEAGATGGPKRWFRIADTYGVEIAPGQSDILILAATAALDQMSH
jgi:uncharacterized protein YxjI